MLKKNCQLLFVGFLFVFHVYCNAQNNKRFFALTEVIQIAQEQSIDGIISKQMFEQNYWVYRTYKAQYLPSLNLNFDVINYSRRYERGYNYGTEHQEYYETNSNTSSAYVTINQNIIATGGILTLNGDLYGNYDLDNEKWDYLSSPFISLSQPIGGFNSFRWDKKIEPERYEIAKNRYIQTLEDIALRAIDLFFELSAAQISMEVAQMNLQNSDTLYQISKGRYEIGTISENELLQMELSFLESKTELNNSKINLDQAKFQIRSYLGYNESVDIELTIPDTILHIEIDMTKAIEQATRNNPELLNQKTLLLEAERDVAQKKAEKRMNANLLLSYGLSRKDTLFPEIITNENNISDLQSINLSLQVPIVDWGLKKGHYKMALLNQEIVQLQAEQTRIDFEQAIILKVLQFNMQEEQFTIAQKSEIVADKNYEVIKQRFLIGKIDVLELNTAQKDRDTHKINYIQSLQNYWRSLYDIRKTTLYDFEKNESIYEKHIKTGDNLFID